MDDYRPPFHVTAIVNGKRMEKHRPARTGALHSTLEHRCIADENHGLSFGPQPDGRCPARFFTVSLVPCYNNPVSYIISATERPAR